jgi:hypothetical protein
VPGQNSPMAIEVNRRYLSYEAAMPRRVPAFSFGI